MDRVLLLSDRDFALARRGALGRLLPARYDLDVASGRPVREFVEVARRLRARGFDLSPASRPPRLDATTPIHVTRLGASHRERDLEILSRYRARNVSEWNERNLTAIDDWDQLLAGSRKTWRIHLRTTGGQATLAALLAEHGPLFVKSLTKGHGEIVRSLPEYVAGFGDLRAVDDDSLTLLVSEILPIASIDASVDGHLVRRTDEWRHYVYAGRRVFTSHAFFCDPRRTSNEHRDRNAEFAESVIARARGTEFATTYVLDTCTLESGGCAIVEANPFFNSGIHDSAGYDPIAGAIAESAGP